MCRPVVQLWLASLAVSAEDAAAAHQPAALVRTLWAAARLRIPINPHLRYQMFKVRGLDMASVVQAASLTFTTIH
jgi:hypothetical protein